MNRPVFFFMIFLIAPYAVSAEDPGSTAPPAGQKKYFAFWQDLNASGSVRLDYFQSSKQLDDYRDFYGATAQAKIVPSFNENFGAKIEGRVTNPDAAGDNTTRAVLLEAYMTGRFQTTDIRIGKQIVAWGRADGVNPTDNLTPRDYTVLLPSDQDQRLGTTSLRVDHYLTSEQYFTLFATPFFEPSKIPLGLTEGVSLTEVTPASTLGNTEIGLKFNSTGDPFDWSVSYFHGFNLLPEIHLIGATSTGAAVELRYPRINVLGADLARNYGRFGLRAEAAYFSTRGPSESDPEAISPFLYSVVGADRTFFENFNVNIQLVARRVMHFQDPNEVSDPVQREVARETALINGQMDRNSYGMTSRISNNWLHNTLEAELFAYLDVTRSGFYIRPLLTYALSDSLKWMVGAEIYHGGENSIFGRLKNNQGGFMELNYVF